MPDSGKRIAAGVDGTMLGTAEGTAAQWKTAREAPNFVAPAVRAHQPDVAG